MGILVFLVVIFLVFLIRYIFQLRKKNRVQKNQKPETNNHVPTVTAPTPINQKSVSDLSPKIDPQSIIDHVHILNQAINNDDHVQFDYMNRHGQKSSREVKPIKFKRYNQNQYIEGYCYLRQEVRTFAIERMSNLVIIDIQHSGEENNKTSQDTEKPISKSDKRPYIQYSTDVIEKIANANWKTLNILIDINHELNFRKRKKAKLLQIKIQKRIEELKNLEEQVKSSNDTPPHPPLPSEVFTHEKGLLRHLGYKVGKKGLSEDKRHKILDFVFFHALPMIEDKEYLRQWGRPKTEKRLHKIAVSLASFTRNAKKIKTKDFSKAIEDWERDLDYLKTNYYAQHFNFYWPSTHIKSR